MKKGVSMKTEHLIAIGIGSVIVAAILASNPHCNRGCQTLAQHLAQHGIDDIIGGLFS
jgi:hypothetical protein